MTELSGNQLRFLNWLLDPRPTTKDEPEGKGSQAKFAKRVGVVPATLTKWKGDPVFRAAWERKHTEVTGGIQMYAGMLEQLRKIAMMEVGGTRPADARAAVMNYLELVQRYQPKKTLEIHDPRLLEASDEDLMAAVRTKLKVIEGGKSPRRARAPARGTRKEA